MTRKIREKLSLDTQKDVETCPTRLFRLLQPSLSVRAEMEVNFRKKVTFDFLKPQFNDLSVK